MDAATQSRKRLERDLRVALQVGQLEMHYQPLIDINHNRMTGVEALMRWKHPEHGWVSPADFIPVAEQSGLIIPLGEWALRRACAEALGWLGLSLSVNVSAVQFRHPGYVASVEQVLAETGFPANRLELEVTESVLLQNADAALVTLNTLKALGLRVAMDDFGTGYSSLSYLHKFPFDKIKIDASFIRGLGHSRDSAAIVRAVLNLGQTLGLETNAEGVETSTELDFLRTEGELCWILGDVAVRRRGLTGAR